jgi:hypothetical protein
MVGTARPIRDISDAELERELLEALAALGVNTGSGTAS